ncbi:MAG: hypothetical protein QOH04_237 [Sphingomonadales bacterium]|jgi:hypothetical protein|nr:hypothetical protein [Sphingomonadales bacterium]
MNAVASPRWFPQRYDAASDSVLLVERSEADFRAAAFLDERSLVPDAPSYVVPWDTVAGAVPPDARRDIQYLFHIGHVGSTLISRLLGELPQVLALREPQILRDFTACLAEGFWEPASIPARLDVLTSLLSRTFRPEQRTMAKATSFVSEIAADLIPAGSRALLLYASPEHYVGNILGGPNSRQEMAATAAGRLERLHRRTGESRWSLAGLSEGETIAMAWACEMSSLVQAGQRLGEERVMWLDFDAFLAEPAAGLGRLAHFFGLDVAAAESLAGHPLMGRYSKAPEYEYDSALREEVLAEARREHGGAIADGLRWLERAAGESEAVARCLDAAEAAG